MNDIIQRINEKKTEFSKSQRIIAEYIANNYEKAAYMTAGKLSENTGVSESTVVRFAHELGFDGYPALQREMRGWVKSKLTPVQRMEIAYEKIAGRDILSGILKSDMGYIEKTLETIDKNRFERAAEVIFSAGKVYITGARSAAALAEFAGFYMNLICDNVCLIKSTGGDGLFEQILNVKPGDAVIGISFPRYSKNTIRALGYAKNNGATVIGITDSEKSPIVSVSDISLIAESGTGSFVDSLTAPLSVINALLVAVGMSNKEKMKQNLEKLEQIWDEYEVYDKND